MLQDDRERGSSVHQRIEKKWLGSIKIPFTTVYFNGKVSFWVLVYERCCLAVSVYKEHCQQLVIKIFFKQIMMKKLFAEDSYES